jgi:predicted nucleotidyltransferase component of viral defense system
MEAGPQRECRRRAVIARDYITAWRAHAPWVSDHQVEQDLVISRALVQIFNLEGLGRRLAFRGGTALYKLYLRPAARYSEDIDLVQVTPEPIGDTFDAVRSVLDPWLGAPRRDLGEGRVSLVYRFPSEDEPPRPLRLKIEVNSREHFTEHGHVTVPLEVQSEWWSGRAEITTYSLDELLGTKLRALYQRRKGRDLFDLWHALTSAGASRERLVACFGRYMREEGHHVTRAAFEENLARKLVDSSFRGDMDGLLRTGVAWDVDEAGAHVLAHVLSRLEGLPWRPPGSPRR